MTDQELHNHFCHKGVLDNCILTQENHRRESHCDICEDGNCLVGEPCPICHSPEIISLDDIPPITLDAMRHRRTC